MMIGQMILSVLWWERWHCILKQEVTWWSGSRFPVWVVLQRFAKSCHIKLRQLSHEKRSTWAHKKLSATWALE
jgi:hypothetical protein